MSSRVHQAGFSIIELLVAMAIFVIVASAGTVVVLGSFSGSRQSEQQTQATLIAQEGLEAARSLRNRGWTTPFLATNCTSGCGLSSAGGNWTWTGSNNTLGVFTRSITVQPVQRDSSGTVVASGGTVDNDIRKVISSVQWSPRPNQTNTVRLEMYVTQFMKAIGGLWTNPTSRGTLNISGNQDALKIVTVGDYAYAVINGGSPNFVVVNISNPSNPTLAGGLTIANTPRNLVISGNYAYVVTTSNSEELIIINISNPTTPTLVGTFDLPGNGDGLSAVVSSNYLYVGRSRSNRPELYVLSITNPTGPQFIGQLETNGDINDIAVNGNNAYLAHSDSSSELLIANIATPNSPVQAGTVDIPGNQTGRAVAVQGSRLFFGLQNGNLYFYNITNPISPSQQAVVSIGDAINDLELFPTQNWLFVANDGNNQELITYSVSSLNSPTQIGVYSAGEDINGISYSTVHSVIIAATDWNAKEIEVIGP